jgi:hypothetical protein
MTIPSEHAASQGVVGASVASKTPYKLLLDTEVCPFCEERTVSMTMNDHQPDHIGREA